MSAAFRLTALVFVPIGLYLYFLPPDVARLLSVSPLWLARLAGGVLLAWGAFLFAAGAQPDPRNTFALAAGNLLVVAALVPPALRLGATLPGTIRNVMLGVALLLGLLAVVGLLVPPRSRSAA